ncbi:MAG: sterol desaturase family protein [Leptospiraceae bacterium]|nr:sterol desaturase family protein [Leptospiraceae bacterium]
MSEVAAPWQREMAMELSIPTLITYAIPAFFVLIVLEWGFSILSNRDLYRLNDSITDLATGVLNRLASFYYLGLTVAIYAFAYKHVSLIEWDYTNSGEFWFAAVLGFVVFDFLYYWAHRMSHEMNFLWAGHVVHHQSEQFNLTVALRQPAFHQLFTWIFFIPLAFLGIHPALLVAIGEVSLIYQFWIHTRLIKRMGPFEWILNTPSHHRVHHGKNPEYIDKNHGGTLIIWDRLFGTFAQEKQEPVYGIVKPFESFNPLWANLHYWKEMWDKARNARGILRKLEVIIQRPGWDPSNPKAAIVIPEVDSTKHQIFDIPAPGEIKAYAMIWFLWITGLTFGILLKMDEFGFVEIGAMTVFTTASLVCIGGILQNRRWAPFAEAIRLVCTATLTYSLVDAQQWMHSLTPDVWMATLHSAACAGSLCFLILRILPHRRRVSLA